MGGLVTINRVSDMSEDEQAEQLRNTVTERNKLRREIACLDAKLENIASALRLTLSCIQERQRVNLTTDGELVAANDAPTLPLPATIKRILNRRIDAEIQLERAEQRIDQM